MNRKKCFSLIELLIVVAVIGIIAAVAIPNLVTSRMAANEASAISSVRTLVTAQLTYSATVGNGQYGAISDLQGANIVDILLGSGTKEGFTFHHGSQRCHQLHRQRQSRDRRNDGSASLFQRPDGCDSSQHRRCSWCRRSSAWKLITT